ncbi:MAG TPA: C25 family cysteine peptidase, partial [Candidatus Polarisedimenticolia bacterium]|nr:C25 family cysteine peptidase [Candidatus Polarisedimenticolia bacterium]
MDPIVGPASLGARLVSSGPSGYRVFVPIPAPGIVTGPVFGQSLTGFELPGASLGEPAGEPQLPSMTLILRLPNGVKPRVTVTPGTWRSLGALRPEPLPHLVRDRAFWASVGAAEVASYLEGAAYRSGGKEAPLMTFTTSAERGDRSLVVTLRPVRWDARWGTASAVDGITLDIAWDGASPTIARAGSRAAAYTGPRRLQPNQPWVRLGVIRPGLYAVSPADLATAGVTPAGIDPRTFRIFRATPGDLPESVLVDAGPDSLRECSISVTGESDGSFDPADRIFFYGTGQTGFGYDLMLAGSPNYQETQRSDEQAMWLTWGPDPSPTAPRRMALRDAAPITAAPTVTTAPHRVHYEENRIRDFNSFAANMRWERWFYRLFTQGSRIAFPLVLPGAQPGGEGFLAMRLWGRGISVGGIIDDHYANLYWNSALIASTSWNFTRPRDILTGGFTVRQTDTLEIQVPRIVDPADPNRFDQSELAWFEVSYPRRLSAINDTLQFAAPDTLLTGVVHYVVDGVTDTTGVWLLDRHDPENPVRYVNADFAGSASNFVMTAQDSIGAPEPTHRFTLTTTARAMRPATIARYAPASSNHAIVDLLDDAVGVDYLIVAHPSLLAAAESLAIFRSGRLSGIPSPRVGIATTDRIAAQLGGGYLDPVAIRNLFAYARLHWTGPALSYVCLVGDASLDPKNYLGFNSPDLVPAYANYYDVSQLAQFISDDFYGFLDGPGDVLLDVAVGRLPGKTTAEVGTMVRAKTQTYETSTEFDEWRARALLSADDSRKRENDDGLGNLHVIEMERKDDYHIPYPIERSKVYLNDYAFADTLRQSKPAAREDFIARVNRGNWFADYAGHGSELVLADEQLFRASDIGRLTNASRPSLFGFFSCTVGKFDALGQEALAELLLKSPNGGAVASIAATELVIPDSSTELNDAFVDQLFPLRPRVDSTRTVGEAYRLAKNLHINTVVRKYVLLGDPALLPPIPRGRGVWEKAPLDSVLRGDVVVLGGHALQPDSSVDNTSNGTVRIQIQGKKFARVQTGVAQICCRTDTVTYRVPGPVLFRGEVPLAAGAFTVRFVMPLDTRIVGTGQLRALLSSAGGRGVGLAVDSLRIAQGISART